VLGNALVVQHKNAQSLRIHRRTVLLNDPLSRIQEQLERRQPLLTVDDVANADEGRRIQLLIKNDRAKEMRCDSGSTETLQRRFKDSLGDVANVLPQRSPLIFPVPHIGTLEQRDHVANVVAKYR
jgi:hypothetical protein